ncbi:hypothetical protein OsJ_24220 [Oryza sativa Japonica Group]|nr:hypothetical protein OsJ_24220 [Oryza sativa Japonica Group]
MRRNCPHRRLEQAGSCLVPVAVAQLPPGAQLAVVVASVGGRRSAVLCCEGAAAPEPYHRGGWSAAAMEVALGGLVVARPAMKRLRRSPRPSAAAVARAPRLAVRRRRVLKRQELLVSQLHELPPHLPVQPADLAARAAAAADGAYRAVRRVGQALAPGATLDLEVGGVEEHKSGNEDARWSTARSSMVELTRRKPRAKALARAIPSYDPTFQRK